MRLIATAKHPLPIIIAAVALVGVLLMPAAASAQETPTGNQQGSIFSRIRTNTVNPGLPGYTRTPAEVTLGVVQVALGFLGLLLILYLLYGGFTWMTSQGNSEKLEQAKGIIRNAIIGLVIVMASYGIAVYVRTQIEVVTEGPGEPGAGGQLEP